MAEFRPKSHDKQSRSDGDYMAVSGLFVPGGKSEIYALALVDATRRIG